MTLLLLTGLALLATSAGLALRAIALPRLRAAERIDAVAGYGDVADADADATGAGGEGLLARTATPIGAFVAARIGRIDVDDLRQVLLRGGYYATRPETFVGLCAMSAVGAGLLGVLLAGGGVAVLLYPLVFAAVGGIAPMRVLTWRSDARAEQIEDALPNVIDLLVVTTEGGLGFAASLQVAARRTDGPLGDELRLTLQEQRMGLSITDALSNMLKRCDTPAMRSFVRSLVQGETLGVSIGTIMRNVAVDVRTRRRTRAEERAHKVPVKMLFPLVFLMFPALLVVLLGPAVLDIKDALGGV